MKRILRWGVLGLVLQVATAHAGVRLQHDCQGGWWAANSATLLALGKLLLPVIQGSAVHWLGQSIGVAPAVMPWVDGNLTSPDWVGASGGVLGLFGTAGLAPLELANVPLRLFCGELVVTAP